jgi:GDPmannose 4,6-dehydratase
MFFVADKVLITGIGGQDGSYLAEHLLDLGLEVHGIARRQSVPENQSSRIEHIKNDIHLHYGDVTDFASVERVVREVEPVEIYNLAAMSHVRISFDMPQFTINTNSLGVLNVLEAYRHFAPEAKFYQASSSEMFGNSVDPDSCQRITTPMTPVSPYGISKVMGFNLTRHYRGAYDLHAKSGILFNHESPRRGSNFVTNKVVHGAVAIHYGQQNELVLGNMDSSRDWGHSYDYVRAMRLINTNDTPKDYVVATGETHTVRELCDHVFSYFGLNYRDYVRQDPAFMRPEELKYLRGDSDPIRQELGWKPKYNFKTLLEEMVESAVRQRASR